MASLTVTARRAKDGPRYVVRFRLGGRAYPIVHAGSFKTLKEAKARRDFVAGELAAGRNPAVALRALSAAPTAVLSLETWADRFLASRIDLAENTRSMYRSHLRKIGETFGARDPFAITAAEIAEWVAEQAEERKAGTVAQYLDVLKVLLAGADVAMMTSALLRDGPDHLRPLEVQVHDWMDRHSFETVEQLRGRLSQRSVPNPATFERANYIKTLASHPVRSR